MSLKMTGAILAKFLPNEGPLPHPVRISRNRFVSILPFPRPGFGLGA
jgi:hypothetical protein